MIRSLLYVPATAERFVARAHERGADAIILDLEDSVAPDEKTAGRTALAQAVPAVGRAGAFVFVRINSETWPDAEAACCAGAAGLFVPKVRDAAALRALGERLEAIERQIGRPAMHLVPLLEDPGAVLGARSIAGASPRVLALACGGEDLATEMDAEPTPEVLRLPKLLVHLAAKAARVLSWGLLRTVADYADTDAIAASAREARALGFDGATCVHPAVVPILNAAFTPTPEAVAHARRMVAAFEAAGGRACAFDGRMIDVPVVERARRLLARAR
jgi:citrate lyase subunit beta/citryl-CoA lyase